MGYELEVPGLITRIFAEFNNGEPDIVFFVHDPDYFGGEADQKLVSTFC